MTYAWKRVGARLPALIAVLALAAIGASWAASSARAATGIQLSVGYADSERATSAKFPTPWAGSPNVIFEGCTPATSSTGTCVFDSSTVRLDNTTNVTQTVNSVIVKFVSPDNTACTFDIWPHDISLPAGDSLILAQTAAKAATGCNPSSGIIDGSELGPDNVNWGGGTHCTTNSGVIPHVITTIGGTTTDFTDSSQVLNTGGDDTNSCPFPINHGRNESEQWTTGGCVNGAAVLTLAPPTQSHVVGDQATITSTLANTCGQAIEGATVNFNALTGPNAGLTGTGTSPTDANGQASFTYTGHHVGTDTWDATLTNPAGTITSNTVNVIWTQATTQQTTGQKITIHDVAALQGFLSGGSGGTVDFQLFSTSDCSGTPLFDSGPQAVDSSTGTASSGNFSLPFTNTNTTYNWLASYSGDEINSPTTSACGTENFSVAGNNLPSGVDP